MIFKSKDKLSLHLFLSLNTLLWIQNLNLNFSFEIIFLQSQFTSSNNEIRSDLDPYESNQDTVQCLQPIVP